MVQPYRRLTLTVGCLLVDFILCFSIPPPAVSLAPSAGNWHGHGGGGGGGGGMVDYEQPVHAQQSYSHSTAHYSHTAHSR